jgi:hypothetical protein
LGLNSKTFYGRNYLRKLVIYSFKRD